jgi:hypothetical protein
MAVFSKATGRLVAAVSATAVVVAAAIMVYFREGGEGLIRPADSLSSSVATQAQDQQQPPQLAHMQLQGQYSGPLVGTAIQRWRDPVDGTVCYVYVPMVVHHTPAPSGYVQYGSNSIGSISCLPGTILVPKGEVPH